MEYISNTLRDLYNHQKTPKHLAFFFMLGFISLYLRPYFMPFLIYLFSIFNIELNEKVAFFLAFLVYIILLRFTKDLFDLIFDKLEKKDNKSNSILDYHTLSVEKLED